MNNNSIALRDELVTIFVILDDLCSILKLNRRGAGRRNSLSVSGEIKIVDSNQLPVCKNLGIPRHKTMKNLSSRSDV